MGFNSEDRKSTRDKANISNPKVNRGCAPLTANRISADCVQISLGPSIPYIPLGVYHTRGGIQCFAHTCTNWLDDWPDHQLRDYRLSTDYPMYDAMS